MSSHRLASRYAKSILDLAKEKGGIETVKTDFQLIQNTLLASKELSSALKNPIIPSDKKKAVLDQIFAGKISDLTSGFIALIANKNREAFLPEILQAFFEQYNVLHQITTIQITSATQLDEATVNTLIESLKAKENLVQTIVELKVDASLIGGFILNYNGKQIDTSVLKSLQKLHTIVEDDSYVKQIR